MDIQGSLVKPQVELVGFILITFEMRIGIQSFNFAGQSQMKFNGFFEDLHTIFKMPPEIAVTLQGLVNFRK